MAHIGFRVLDLVSLSQFLLAIATVGAEPGSDGHIVCVCVGKGGGGVYSYVRSESTTLVACSEKNAIQNCSAAAVQASPEREKEAG